MAIILFRLAQLDINRAVETSRSRYRAYRRHRCRRYGVREGLLLIQVVFTKKVQMKRSVTGDDADGCCPQRKSPCPTLVGRKTKALYGKADWEEPASIRILYLTGKYRFIITIHY